LLVAARTQQALLAAACIIIALQSRTPWKGMPASLWRDNKFDGRLHFWQIDTQESSWLLFNTCCALLLPFIELLGHLGRPLRMVKRLTGRAAVRAGLRSASRGFGFSDLDVSAHA
jgi:hypothetical protein